MKGINKNAPVKCNKTFLINASPEKVWAVLTNIDQWTNWLTDISKSKLNGELKPNTTFVWNNKGVKIHSVLHTVDPFNHIGWTGKTLGLFAIHNWTLTKADGQTQVTVEESMEGLLVHLFKGTINKSLEKGMTNWLALLKLECEK